MSKWKKRNYIKRSQKKQRWKNNVKVDADVMEIIADEEKIREYKKHKKIW